MAGKEPVEERRPDASDVEEAGRAGRETGTDGHCGHRTQAPILASVPWVRVNGVSLYYEEHGSGEPLLGIHGGGSSAAMWAGAAPRLAACGRTILYDRRGCSRSERREPYATNIHEQADDAATLIAALEAAPAVLDCAQLRRRDRG